MQLTLFTDENNLVECNEAKQVLHDTKFEYTELPFEQLVNENMDKAPILQIELDNEVVFCRTLEKIKRWAYLYSRRRDV